MKNFLLLIAIVPILTFGQIGEVIFYEDFESGLEGWTFYDEDGDNRIFELWNYDNSEGYVLESDSYNNGEALTPDNYAVTSAIDLSNAAGAITLTWRVEGPDAEYDGDQYTVYVATANDVASLKSSATFFNEPTLDGVNEPTTRTLDISSFGGESEVYIAFRHHDSTDQFRVRFYDVLVEAETILSVDDNNLSSKNVVYPNPVKESFNVKLNNKFKAESTTITLTDVSGKVVRTFDYADKFNVSSLAKGVYIVTITDGNQTISQKLIKE